MTTSAQRLHRWFVVMALVGAGWLFAGAATLQAVPLDPGDIVVADIGPFGGGGGSIIKVDPVTGTQALIASATDPGSLIDQPWDVAFEADGKILVADVGQSAIIRIDPTTGTQSIVSSGGLLSQPFALDVDRTTGTIFVAERAGERILSIDPVSGIQQNIGAPGGRPTGIELDSDGTLVFAVQASGGSGVWLRRLDPLTNTVTTHAFFSNFPFTSVNAAGVTIEADGDILMANPYGNGSVLRVDPDTNTVSTVAFSGLLGSPWGIDLEANGQIVVADYDVSGAGGVLRVDPITGTTSAVSTGGLLDRVRGLEVVPVVIPEPSAMLLALFAIPAAFLIGSRRRAK